MLHYLYIRTSSIFNAVEQNKIWLSRKPAISDHICQQHDRRGRQ